MARIFSARVQGGVIVADGLDLPEGSTVTVVANDSDSEPDCDLAPDELAELDAAIADADADDRVISHDAVLAELDRILAHG